MPRGTIVVVMIRALADASRSVVKCLLSVLLWYIDEAAIGVCGCEKVTNFLVLYWCNDAHCGKRVGACCGAPFPPFLYHLVR